MQSITVGEGQLSRVSILELTDSIPVIISYLEVSDVPSKVSCCTKQSKGPIYSAFNYYSLFLVTHYSASNILPATCAL